MSWGIVASAGATIVGGMLADDGGGQTSTASKEPWAEVAPWLKDLIAQGQGLSEQYAAQPFNTQQQEAYNNTFQDINSLRGNVVPVMNDVANNMLSQNYQRAPQRLGFNGGAAGMLPGGGGGQMQPQQQQQGLMGAMGYQGQQPSPLGAASPIQSRFDMGAAPVGAPGGMTLPFQPGSTPFPTLPAPAPAAAPAQQGVMQGVNEFMNDDSGHLLMKRPGMDWLNFHTMDYGTGNGGA